MKKKEKRFNFSKLLTIILILIPITGFILIVIGGNNDNDTLTFTGFGLFPLFGILMIPKIIKYAIKNVKELDTKYEKRKVDLNNKFKNENINIYHKRIVFESIKTAVLAIIAIITIMILLIYVSGNVFTDEGHYRLENRPIIRKIFHKTRDIEGVAALFVLGILIFGIPIIVYAITYYIYKIRMILKKKYVSYIAKVNAIDLKNRIHLIGKNDCYQYTIDDYKCIGIRKKDIVGKEVIIVCSLDKAYILPTK